MLKFEPVKTALVEEEITKIIKGMMKSGCEHAKVGDVLYLQPVDDNDMDSVVEKNVGQDSYFAKNDIKVAFETKTIAELAPQHKKAGVAKQELKEPEMKQKASLAEMHEEGKDKAEDFDTQVMKAINETGFKARAKAPDEFFNVSTEPTIYVPIFLLYLFIIVITKTVGAIFS